MKTSGLLLLISCLALVPACVTEAPPEPAIQASPEEAAIANLRLGAEYLRRNDLEAALNKLQKAVDQNPRLPQAHATLALAFERLGNEKRATEHYRDAVRLAENDASIDNMYGAFLCRQREFADAEKYFLKAAKNPRYRTPAAAYTNAGVCELRNDNVDGAEGYFRDALAVNPRYPDALWQMAELSFSHDRALQSRAFLERLSAMMRLPANALWLAMQVEEKLGDGAAAAKYGRSLKSQFPDSPETGLLLEQERNGG